MAKPKKINAGKPMPKPDIKKAGDFESDTYDKHKVFPKK